MGGRARRGRRPVPRRTTCGRARSSAAAAPTGCSPRCRPTPPRTRSRESRTRASRPRSCGNSSRAARALGRCSADGNALKSSSILTLERTWKSAALGSGPPSVPSATSASARSSSSGSRRTLSRIVSSVPPDSAQRSVEIGLDSVATMAGAGTPSTWRRSSVAPPGPPWPPSGRSAAVPAAARRGPSARPAPPRCAPPVRPGTAAARGSARRARARSRASPGRGGRRRARAPARCGPRSPPRARGRGGSPASRSIRRCDRRLWASIAEAAFDGFDSEVT